MTFEMFRNRPARFWIAMGPFFASREVRKEMPYLMDHDGDTWWIAWNRKEVAGFMALRVEPQGKAVTHGLFVLPKFRRQSIASKLVGAGVLLSIHEGCRFIESTCTEASKSVYANHGFKAHRARGQYTVMRRDRDT